MTATSKTDTVRAQRRESPLLTRNHGSKLRTVFWQGWLALKSKPLRIPVPVQIELAAFPKPKRLAK